MKLEIVNERKLGWNYVKKVTVKVTDGGFNYEAPLSIHEISRIHFITGKLLEEYYSEVKP